jgi:hypothetical protein
MSVGPGPLAALQPTSVVPLARLFVCTRSLELED